MEATKFGEEQTWLAGVAARVVVPGSRERPLAVGEGVLPPSKFDAGYTVSGPPAAPPAPQAATTGGFPPGSGATPRQARYQVLSPQAPPGDPDAVAATEGTNSLAVAAFVLAMVFGPFAVAVTLPMAYLARRQITQTGQGGAGLATAAVMISYVYLALGVTVLALSL